MTVRLSRLGFALAAVGALGGVTPADARTVSATAGGIATATVIAPITVVQLADLDFGLIIEGRAGDGTATIAPFATAVAFAGSTRSGCASGGMCVATHPARFAVSGEPARSYIVSLPAALTIAPESGAQMDAQSAKGAPLRVTGFTVRSAGQPDAGGRARLDPSGHDSFEVGATLQVPSGCAPGRYRTSLAVIVTYG